MGSFQQWYLQDVLGILAGRAHVAQVLMEEGSLTCRLQWESVASDWSFILEARNADGEVLDLKAIDGWCLGSTEDDLQAPNEVSAAVRGLLEGWCRVAQMRLERAAEHVVGLELDTAAELVLPSAPLADIIALWLVAGPPPPPAPRLMTDLDRRSRAGLHLERLTVVDSSPWPGSAPLVEHFRLGSWDILLEAGACDPWVDSAGVRIARDGEEPVTVFLARSDGQSYSIHIADHDRELAREFMGWLEHVLCASERVESLSYQQMILDELVPRTTSLPRWFELDLMHDYDPPPLLDPRVQGDAFEARLMTEAPRPEATAVYHRFIREFIDPGFGA